MIEVFGEKYYIDLESINKVINIESELSFSGSNETTINIVSFEIVKMMLEIVMTEREEVDENLGLYGIKNTSIPFRLAFNTLLMHKIIKHL